MKNFLFVIYFLFIIHPDRGNASGLPAVVHYNIDAQFHLKEQRVSIVATLLIRNTSGKSHVSLPFLLYRLLAVEQMTDRSGTPMRFDQHLVSLSDEPSLQVNVIQVELPFPLAPNDSITVVMKYAGYMFGYPEVMAYVRDRIDEDYTLMRPDAFAWPALAEPSFASILEAGHTRFTYMLSASVPKEYTVACGGELQGVVAAGKSQTFTFRSKIPAWRIDVAVARFEMLGSQQDKLFVYHLPEDRAGAKNALNASMQVIRFYRDVFGTPANFNGYTIIEIPEGWGSQAADFYFLQTAAAFRDSTKIPEIYHEIGHTWNATPAPEVQRCRYFDEAFASFFAAMAIEHFRGSRAFVEEMERLRATFVRQAKSDTVVLNTPIAGYGRKELGRYSYTKGAWSLYVLREIVGAQSFSLIIRTMLTTFSGRTINFQEFQELCEQVSNRNLKRFFDEWIFGKESSRLLQDSVSVKDMAALSTTDH